MAFDFSVLDAALEADAVEDGKWLHIKADGDGPELYMTEEGKPTIKETPYPCRVLVRSTMSKAFDGHLDKIQRRAVDEAQRGKGKKGKEQMLANLKKQRPESFAALAVAFENVSGTTRGEIRPTPSEMMDFARPPMRRWIVDQVLEYGSENRNFSSVEGDEDGDLEVDQGNDPAGAGGDPPAPAG